MTSTCIALAALLALQTAAPPPSPPPTPTAEEQALQRLYGDGQALVGRYSQTGNVEDLRLARGRLTQWLSEHQVVYGTQPAAESVREPIRRQVSEIDAILLSTSPPPPPPPPPNPAGRRMITAGAILIPVGVILGATVSIPLFAISDNSRDRANEQRFFIDERRWADQAERTRRGGWVSLGFSLAMVGAGIGLLTAGIIRRSTQRQVAVAPVFGDRFGGVSARFRF